MTSVDEMAQELIEELAEVRRLIGDMRRELERCYDRIAHMREALYTVRSITRDSHTDIGRDCYRAASDGLLNGGSYPP